MKPTPKRIARGIVTVLNTPFTDADSIDVAGLRKNALIALDAGVAGYLVPALASEVGSLTEAERRLIVETVVEAAGSRVPVIGGGSAPTQVERMRIASELISLGCDGVLVNMPLGDEDIFERDLAEIAALNPGFVMLQDWDPSGPGLPVPFIARLSERIPEFTWLKIEVIPAGPKYSEVLDATCGRLNVAGGWAVMQMIEGLDRGVHAFMPTGMHRIYTRIFTLYEAGRRDESRELFERILPVLAFTNQRLDISIQFFKRLLHAQGVYATPRVRPPVGDFDSVQARIASELIERVLRIEADLSTPGVSPK